MSDFEQYDLAISIGGDGTLIHTINTMKYNKCPILAFNTGSMGFLTPFNCIKNNKPDIEEINRVCLLAINGPFHICQRTRLSFNIIKPTTVLKQQYDLNYERKYVLNEVFITRGTSLQLCNLECYLNDVQIATIQADGLIIATSTGSTAYSLSAGGLPISPILSDVICFTPVCPHVLSSKPLILPLKESTYRIVNSKQARGTATVYVDGLSQCILQPGESIEIVDSFQPIYSVCKETAQIDWFSSLRRCLNWNVRIVQK